MKRRPPALRLGVATHRIPRPGEPPVPRLLPEPVVLDDETLVRHTLLIGSTGSGKTSLFLYLAAQQIRRGGGLIFIDAKPGADTLRTLVALALEAGRPHDLNLLCPGRPFSHSYNFIRDFSGASAVELADRLQALYYSKESEYYRVTQHAFLLAVAEAMQALGAPFHIGDVCAACLVPDALRDLLRLVRERGLAGEYVRALPMFLSNAALDRNLLAQVSGIARTLLRYIAGDFGRITLVHHADVDLQRIIENNEILYFQLPFMRSYETTIAWAVAFLVHLMNTVGRLIERGRRAEPAFLVLADEAGKYAGSALTTLTEQARAAGIALLVAGQSTEQFRSDPKHGDNLKIIKQNTAVKVAARIVADDEIEQMAKLLGEVRVVRPTQASLRSPADPRPGMSLAEKETPVVHPAFLRSYTDVGRAFASILPPGGAPRTVLFRWPLVRPSREALRAADEFLSTPWTPRCRPPERILGLYERYAPAVIEAVLAAAETPPQGGPR